MVESSACGQVRIPTLTSDLWYSHDLNLSRIGSTLHALKALRNPRWEDYNYEQADDIQNRMYWLGDGQTWNEKTLTGDSACLASNFGVPRAYGRYRSVVFKAGMRRPASR